MIVKLPIDKIVIPQGLLPRIFGVKEEKVEEYAEAMESGAEFPPIKVWQKPDGTYQVIDGVHRISAYRKLGKKYIEAEIIQDIEDEVEFMERAAGENLSHGLPLSKEDKMELARRLYFKGRKPEKIANLLKIKVRTIYNWIKDIIDEKKHQKEELKKKALELKKQGKNSKEIAEILGVPDGTVRRWLFKNENFQNRTPETDLAKTENFQKLPNTPNPHDLAIQLHNEGLKDEEIQQKILEETEQDIPLKTIKDWIAEYKGKLWDATGWGKSAQTETQPEPEEYEDEDLQHTEEQFLQEYQQELTTDPTTEEIKQIISEMRKKGYNKFQIVKYLVDGEDIDGYTFDQIAKAFDTDAQSIEELYNEALEIGIKTPRPYQKGKAGRKPKDTSTAFDHEAQFEKKIAEAKLFVSSTLANIANTWGQDYAEKALAILRDWINDDKEMTPFTTPLNK